VLPRSLVAGLAAPHPTVPPRSRLRPRISALRVSGYGPSSFWDDFCSFLGGIDAPSHVRTGSHIRLAVYDLKQPVA